MESFLHYSRNFLQEFFEIRFDFPYLVYGTLLVIFSAPFGFILAAFYKKIRTRFPVKVNCWFCNTCTSVPYDLINSWDCPHCKQYNGFNKDGSYNKIIEEQYDSKLNEDIFNTLKPSISSGNCFQVNGLCKLCNINQQLKIQQLALFTPLDEDNYYEEVEKYREKLEKAYSLCSKCEGVLKETLEKQEYNLLQNRLNNHKLSASSQLNKIEKKNLIQLAYKNGVVALRLICLIVSFFQFFFLIIQFDSQHHILNLVLPELEILKIIIKNLIHYSAKIQRFNKELSFAGFASCLFMYSTKQAQKVHINLLVWGLLHILFWTALVEVQMVLGGICLYLSAKSTRKQFVYVNKNSLHKKSGFQPVKKIFPDVYNISSKEADIIDPISCPTPNIENLGFTNQKPDLKKETNKMCQNENIKVTKKSNLEKPKRKSRKEEHEEEAFLNQDKVHSTECTGETNVPLNSSVFNKSFLASLEPGKNESEMSGPFNEVYNGLNGLHLGGKQKKSNKSSNFLFSSNFSQAKNSSIIKPAKLIKNLNSTSWSESSEYNSRSSTPSSQKTEKADRYDFFKTMTPISVGPYNRHSPVNCWDYDGSNGLYNNFNYFPNGFLPFQQFPGPMGHTTIYTCSRPTNFPFPFSPWQGFSNPKFSPTSRFSDASDCDNLFQDTSKNFEKNKKWFKLKKFSYYFSLLLNIFTLLGLAYFVSTGIILVDWKLPTFNFFQ